MKEINLITLGFIIFIVSCKLFIHSHPEFKKESLINEVRRGNYIYDNQFKIFQGDSLIRIEANRIDRYVRPLLTSFYEKSKIEVDYSKQIIFFYSHFMTIEIYYSYQNQFVFKKVILNPLKGY